MKSRCSQTSMPVPFQAKLFLRALTIFFVAAFAVFGGQADDSGQLRLFGLDNARSALGASSKFAALERDARVSQQSQPSPHYRGAEDFLSLAPPAARHSCNAPSDSQSDAFEALEAEGGEEEPGHHSQAVLAREHAAFAALTKGQQAPDYTGQTVDNSQFLVATELPRGPPSLV